MHSRRTPFSPADKPVALELSFQNDELVVSVRDQGSGIAPENHEMVFDRFAQAGQGSALVAHRSGDFLFGR